MNSGSRKFSWILPKGIYTTGFMIFLKQNMKGYQVLFLVGKSMEFQPEGKVRLTLKLGSGGEETYTWNKITTCIHNLLGAERWVDLYGECVIGCQESGLTARLQFVKASYWSSKRHELFGSITDAKDSVVQNMFGKWSEALYVGKAPSARCIWRPGALPDDAHLYYGFSRLAMELNELIPKEVALLPPTDTRWRPDQRALEEGRIAEAENIKLGVEQAQRDRRRLRENGEVGKTITVYTRTYLQATIYFYFITYRVPEQAVLHRLSRF